jgi:HD-like signal output (HDOD) protein
VVTTPLPASGPGLREQLLDEASDLTLGNPEAFLRVASMCRDPRADARAVALEIQRDEGFAAVVLRLANSAYYASASRIGDLPTAVARIGLGTVEGLALSIPGARLTGDNSDGLGAARRELHRHAIRTGLAARMIAPPDDDHEQALAAGLVHNLGLSVIALLRGEVFRQLLEVARAGEQLAIVEEEVLGFTHAELGALLAERWRFPLPLVMAIVEHDSADATGLAGITRVADLLAREAGVGVEAPRPIAVEEAALAGISLEAARARVTPLFEAHERLEGGARPAPEARVAEALDGIVA